MRQVKVYGPGCQKCHLAEERVQRVIREHGLDAEIEKVSDYAAMMAAGILSTPAVAVDGEVKLAGRVPTEKEILAWLAS